MTRAPILVLLLSLPALAGDLEKQVVAAELGRRYDEPLLRRAAASPDASTRRAAARAAGRLKETRAVAWLLPLLGDDVGPVRRAALFALGRIGGGDVALALRERLPRLDASDLPFALEAVGKTGDPRTVAAVAARLGHAEAHVRAAAALALFRLRDSSALPDAFAALAGERDDRVRWKLVYAAWRLLRERTGKAGGPVAADGAWTEALTAAAHPERPFEERVFAVRGLAELRGTRETVLGLLEDEDPRVVAAAVRGLARDWDADVAGKVAAATLSSDDPLLRELGLEHLVAGGEAAGPQLRRAWETLAANHRLGLRAREAAAAAGEDVAVAAETDMLPEHHEEMAWRVNAHFPARLPGTAPTTLPGRRAAAEVCGEERVPPEVAVPMLRELLRVDDFTVRSTAIGSLAKRGAKEQAPAIAAAAAGAPGPANVDVRLAAAEALAKLGVHDPWLDRAAAEDPERHVRAAAREALAELGRALPPARPARGFRLHGHDASGILEAAEALRGARVELETSRGTIEMVLYPDEAPAHCVNFATLVEQGFYDGLSWHRVVANFVVQGGCPRGDGWGGPGYFLPDEIGTRPYVRGTVGMPRSGNDTGGCQIFITHLPTPHLDGHYTVFAQVVRGLNVVDQLRVGDKILKATIRLGGE